MAQILQFPQDTLDKIVYKKLVKALKGIPDISFDLWTGRNDLNQSFNQDDTPEYYCFWRAVFSCRIKGVKYEVSLTHTLEEWGYISRQIRSILRNTFIKIKWDAEDQAGGIDIL